jgi:uncharacterized membrane protein YciS (DUF1049 family)
MAKFLRGLIFWPLLVLAVALAIANRNAVQFSFDPFNAENPAFAVSVPLFMILMAGLLIGILLGGMSAWADQGHWRRMAREARRRVAQLEAEQAAQLKTASNDSGTALVPVKRAAR